LTAKPSPDPIVARTLTVGFSDSEDRLWMRLGTDERNARQLWLTRRMLQQVFAQVWVLLAKTLPGDALRFQGIAEPGSGRVGYAPEELRKRNLQLMIERELSLEDSPPMDEDSAKDMYPGAMQASPVNDGLLRTLNITADEKAVRFLLHGPATAIEFHGARADAHRVLQMLWKMQESADWGLEPPWSGEPAS
jgi:hypothetical protein